MRKMGLIGIGAMGSRLALNLAEHEIEVHVYDRDSEKTKEIVRKWNHKFNNARGLVVGHESIRELTRKLPERKIIVLLVPQGRPVEDALRCLRPLLDKDDVVVDAGNSHYADTERRMAESRFSFIGCGISGGVHGARRGASIVFGGDPKAYERIRDIFESISASCDGEPCCGIIGSGGSGHFVKAVHNGIEYCEMQLLQEAYNIISYGKDQEDAVEATTSMLRRWKDCEAGGFLSEICEKILQCTKENEYVINSVVDEAKQKGTGKMCVEAALDIDCPVTAMSEAVMARFISLERERRGLFSERFATQRGECECGGTETFFDKHQKDTIERAFLLAKAVSFIQGFDLIDRKQRKEEWNVSLEEVCKIWRKGCIIQSKFLETCIRMVQSSSLSAERSPFEISEAFAKIYRAGIRPLRMLCISAVSRGIPIPVFSSCLSWLDGMATRRNGELIQAMRDAFGNHTVQTFDGTSVQIDWLGDREKSDEDE